MKKHDREGLKMRKNVFTITMAALLGGLVLTPLAAAQAQAAPEHYSVKDTLVGQLLDDPAALAILKKTIPTVVENQMFRDAGRALTLGGVQQYEPDALSDANLAKIQAEFDKIPAKAPPKAP